MRRPGSEDPHYRQRNFPYFCCSMLSKKQANSQTSLCITKYVAELNILGIVARKCYNYFAEYYTNVVPQTVFVGNTTVGDKLESVFTQIYLDIFSF